VVLYGVLALFLAAKLEEESLPRIFFLVLGPTVVSLVLLLLPSSRAWCFPQRGNTRSGTGTR
jgi:hypothetical protein